MKNEDREKISVIPFTSMRSTAFFMALIAGFVDVFGYVVLSHLFTAHITGNIVVAIAEIIGGSPGLFAKILALPLFIVIAILVAYVVEMIGQTKRLLIFLLIIETLLLLAFMLSGLYIFPSGPVGSWQYLFTGMLAVSAMAIHNTLLRTFMTSLPPVTVMTGNFCQLIVDSVTKIYGKKLAYPLQTLSQSESGIRRHGGVLLGFFIGGGLAALGYITIGFWSILSMVIIMVYLISKV